MSVKYARMGDTGLIVSRLSLGTMTFGTGQAGQARLGVVEQDQATALVDRALDAGINSFNSASTYGSGQSEEILGKALGKRRHDAVITTKVGFRSGKAVTDGGLSARSIINTAEGCLRRLNTDWIDVFSVHRVDEHTPLAEVVEAMDTLVRQGKVRYVGFANWPAWMVGRAAGLQEGRNLARFRVGEMYYALNGRDIEHSHLPLLAESGIGLFVWSPLSGGLLSGKYVQGDTTADRGRMSKGYALPFDWELAFKVVEVTRQIATTHGSTPAQVALAWLLSRREVTSVLVGVSNLSQLEENLASTDLTLSAEELSQLDEVSALTRRYPDWFTERNKDQIIARALGA